MLYEEEDTCNSCAIVLLRICCMRRRIHAIVVQ
jgi:hypothetical protein